MTTYIIIAAAIILFLYIGKRNAEKTAKTDTQADASLPKLTLTVQTSGDMEFYTKIAGVQHYCTAADIGSFMGVVAPDENNQYDKNACAVLNNSGKLVGYIPADRLTEYREWSGCKPMLCVGYIKDGSEVPLFGKAKVINADEDDAALITAKFVRWMVATFGKKYVPEGFKLNTDAPLKTKADWLAALDEYIESHEE